MAAKSSKSLKTTLQAAQKLGRGKDTILAHITPEEAALLKARGGSGTINPRTGLREYSGYGSSDYGDSSQTGGSFDSSDSSNDDSALASFGDSVVEFFGGDPVEAREQAAKEWEAAQSSSPTSSSSDSSSPSNTYTSSGLTFEQQMALKDKELATAKELAELEKQREADKLQAQKDKQEAAGMVAGVNVDQQAVDILDDPEAFLTNKGGTLSDNVPTVSEDAAGTTIGDTSMVTDALAVDEAQGTVTTATGAEGTATQGTATEGTAATATGAQQGGTSTYTAVDTTAQVAAQDAEAQLAEVRQEALVDAANAQIDMQGMATGRNKDGSINSTGIALSKYANLDIANVIDTSTTAGKEMARQLGEGNYVDYKSTVQGQLDILSKAFVDANGNPKIPSFAAGAARNVSRIAAFKGVTGTAATAAMATALMESMLPVAQADAKFFQTVQLKNLDNKQQQTINTANILSKFELTNQDARMTAAITNAKTFMQYDLTNLANRQQVEILNTQNRVQSILESAKEENVARRFASQSQNDMDMFYDNLHAQISQFNAAQKNAMEQFNVGEVNAMEQLNVAQQNAMTQFNIGELNDISQFNAAQTNAMTQFNVGEVNDTNQFNATLENNREQFYKDMQFQIDAANAKWRQTVTLTNAEMEFEAAALDVKNIVNISTETLNQLWDRADAQLDYVWKSSESELDRANNIELAKLQIEAAKYAARAKGQSDQNNMFWQAVGTFAGAYFGGSDIQLKNDLKRVGTNAQGLGLYTWNWNNEARKLDIDVDRVPSGYGVIAQEVQRVLPEAVLVHKASGYLMVDYSKINLAKV